MGKCIKQKITQVFNSKKSAFPEFPEKHAGIWTGYSKLPLGVNEYIKMCFCDAT